jgi:glycine/D-amino acid oxidase-like deaminating enzyme
LFTTIGAVFMGEPGHEYIRRTYDTLSAIGVVAEWLEPSEIARRWPPIAIEGLGPAVFERDAGALRARAAVLATVRHAVAQHSVEYRTAAIKPFDEARGDVVLETLDGIRLEADAYVVAGGPWLPRLFPQAVGGRIRATRQEVLYFGTPPSDDRYASTSLPIWIDFGAGLYGIPDLDGHGFKVGIDAHGPSIDPDTADRIVDPHIVASTARWLPSRFPGLAGAPLIDARVCQYESTSSGDFLIDRHPAWPNLLIVGGGSGHGFKHGPAVGRYVADLLDGRTAPEPRFALEGKATLAQRAVF